MKDAVQMGFRVSKDLWTDVKQIAEEESRSVANVLTIFVQEQVKRVQEGGFRAAYNNNNIE